MQIKGRLTVYALLYCSSAATHLKVQDAQEGEEWKKSVVRTYIGRTSTHFAYIGWQKVNPAFSLKNFIKAKEIQMPS